MPARVLPLPARLALGHGFVEAAARSCGADVLHIKGPAVPTGLRPPGRVSSDVDVLVRPGDADRLLAELASRGCRMRAGFESGSYFRHAATLFHDQWGWIDVHRLFPGIGLGAREAFGLLWLERTSTVLAGQQVQVPSSAHHCLLLVLNAARDVDRREADVAHLRSVSSASAWRELERCVTRFDAGLAFAAATGTLDAFAADPERDLWHFSSRGGGRWAEWHARWRVAATARARVRVVRELVSVNREWLAAELGRQPSRTDLWRAQRRRLRAGVDELWRRASRQ